MLPSFDFEGGLPLTAARAASVAALLSVFGALVFQAVVAPRCFERLTPEVTAQIGRRLRRLIWISLGAYVAADLGWLVLQAADMAGASSAAQAMAAVPDVMAGTAFGRLLLLQLAAMALVAITLLRRGERRPWVALTLATAAAALQAGHSHAASMSAGPSVVLASDVLHLLGAGAWLGGLVPLLIVVRIAPPRGGATAARWFSPLGKLCLVVMTGTALVQGWVLIASVPGLVGTAYGWVALAKLALFGILFGFALANRYRLFPALLRADPDRAKRRLLVSIAVQSCFGLAVVATASGLSSLEPAMHAQPLWPFAKRLSLEAVREDADYRREAIGAGLALAGAAALLILAVVSRRVRWPAVAAAAIIAWFATPHLTVLLAGAEPTYYYRSPTGFTAASIVAGAALYPANCANCHGAEGHGDGPAGAGLAEPPADLGAAHLWMHSDGELFWWLSDGMEAADGSKVMPGFASKLSVEQRWALIDFIRARNAGQATAGSGTPALPIQAPSLQATCDGRTVSLADWRGWFVRLVFGPAETAQHLVTISTATGSGAPAGTCVADDESLASAYSLVSGVPTGALPGTQFLIDDRGWLRAFRPGGWPGPGALEAEMHDLEQHPVAASAAEAHMDMPM